jgi:protein-tyrosine phosphatase
LAERVGHPVAFELRLVLARPLIAGASVERCIEAVAAVVDRPDREAIGHRAGVAGQEGVGAQMWSNGIRVGESTDILGVLHAERHLSWDGCANVRDLGGMPTQDGRETRRRAVIRADGLDLLTGRGWSALVAYGVRTVIDLRNEEELGPDVAPRPDDLRTIHLPLDGVEDGEFWEVWERGPQYGTPLYYASHLARFPHLSARVIAAIALAPAGGVVVHCGEGRDRTGQIVMLALALVGVAGAHIADDYMLSHERLRVRYRARGEVDQGVAIETYLRERGTGTREVVLSTLAGLDVEAVLLSGGLDRSHVDALRARLLAPRR